MAELLVKAQGNKWMEELAKESWSLKGLSQEKYDARGEKGDVVEVRRDGAVYGTLECLPDFVIIKVPEIKEWEKLKTILEGPLVENVTVEGKTIQKLRKKRKHHVPASVVDEAIESKGMLTLTKTEFADYLKTRSLDADKKIISSMVAVRDLDG